MTRARELEKARRRMVERQIRDRGVVDGRVLKAMFEVARHEFVPVELLDEAYEDGPLPIGHGQTISQPYIVAWMSELLRVEPSLSVLEVGSGCGYQTAVLCRLARHVYAMERIEPLAEQARINLVRAGADNFTLRVGDGTLGWPEHAPFQRILVAAAAERLPVKLVEQLAPGGRMVLPMGSHSLQEMTVVERDRTGAVRVVSHGPVRFVPLIEDNSGNEL